MAIEKIASPTKALPLGLLLIGLSPFIALAEDRDRDPDLALESLTRQTNHLLLEEKTAASAAPPTWQPFSQTESAIALSETEKLTFPQEQLSPPHLSPASLSETALSPQTLVEAGLEPTILTAEALLPSVSTQGRASAVETKSNSDSGTPNRHPEALPSDGFANTVRWRNAGRSFQQQHGQPARSLHR